MRLLVVTTMTKSESANEELERLRAENKLLKRELFRMQQAAKELLAQIDCNLNEKPWPVKYGVPFGAALKLAKALRTKKG